MGKIVGSFKFIRSIFFAIFFSSSLLASDVSLKVASSLDVDRLFELYKAINFSAIKTDDKSIKEALEREILFASEYLKAESLDSHRDRFTLMINNYLANRYVEKLFMEIDIEDEILKSYYFVNKSKYITPKSYRLYIISSKSKSELEDELSLLKKMPNNEKNSHLRAKKDGVVFYRSIPKRDLPSYIDIVVENLDVGSLSSIFNCESNYCFVYYTQLFEPRELSFEESRDMIKRELIEKRKIDILRKEYDRLRVEK